MTPLTKVAEIDLAFKARTIPTDAGKMPLHQYRVWWRHSYDDVYKKWLVTFCEDEADNIMDAMMDFGKFEEFGLDEAAAESDIWKTTERYGFDSMLGDYHV